MKAEEVCRLMNRFGNEKRPCVWGFDYGLKRGFFLGNPDDTSEILWEMEGIGNSMRGNGPTHGRSTMEILRAPGFEEYSEAFAVVSAGLRRGDSFLANLTASSEVTVNVSLEDIFHDSPARFKFKIGDEFVCFSPEPFVTINGCKISTYPMKGTAEGCSRMALRQLMDDYKEQCEHATVVDLLRNDLAMVATGVTVKRYRYAEVVYTLKGTLLQTSSEITGNLEPEWSAGMGSIIMSMLPAGSICGAPKQSTVDLIGRAERCGRGWYTGVAGYFDGENLKSAVMIRCLQRGADGKLRFHSGGGITINSDCKSEYEELIGKIYLPC